MHDPDCPDASATGRQPNDLIVRTARPENLEFPFSTLIEPIVESERFYVRSHFDVPEIDLAGWRLRVEGAVDRPLELSYEALRAMPDVTHVALLECAGNSRSFLNPPVKGVQWELGAVGNAGWTGVSLAAVLERAEARPEAVEVVLEGADRGEVCDDPKPHGTIHYARSIPVEKAREPQVILAYAMNGQPLCPSHGFPVRAIVPGWYAMASVKWLTRIVVLDRPFAGYYQTVDYAYFERHAGLPERIPLAEMQVKAEIARPAPGEVIPAGSPYRVHGAAWSGEAPVTKVEVSTDGGATWSLARPAAEPERHTWCLWEYDWQVPAAPGRRALMARATDARGRTQPVARDHDRGNYMVNEVLRIEVEVR